MCDRFLTSARGWLGGAVVLGAALSGHVVRHTSGQQDVHAEQGEARHLAAIAVELVTAVLAGPMGTRRTQHSFRVQARC